MKYIYFLFAAVTLPLALSAQNPLAFDIKRIEGEGNAGRELEITQSSIDSMFILGNHFIDQPVYEAHQAPILVEVVDLDSIISSNYIVQFDGSNFFGLLDSSANWKMYREGVIDNHLNYVIEGCPCDQYHCCTCRGCIVCAGFE